MPTGPQRKSTAKKKPSYHVALCLSVQEGGVVEARVAVAQALVDAEQARLDAAPPELLVPAAVAADVDLLTLADGPAPPPPALDLLDLPAVLPPPAPDLLDLAAPPPPGASDLAAPPEPAPPPPALDLLSPEVPS